MDPSLRSSLFNRMMQAMELGDKCTADKIESLIRNFCLDSPVPVSVYVPSSEDTFIPNISPPSSNSDSPTMPRSPKPTSSKRRASRAPRESLLDAQTTVDSDVEDHQRDRLHFSPDRPCSFDTEVNVVGEDELRKYKSRFDIPDSVTLMLPGDRAAWNPPENVVAIYGVMLSCEDTDVPVPYVEVEGLWAPYPPRDPPLLYSKAGGQWWHVLPSLFACGELKSLRVWRTLVKLRSPVMRRRKVSSGASPLQIKGGKTVGFSPVASGVGMCQLAVAAIFWRRKFPGISHLLKPVCDFDTVCDLQARTVKNSEAANKRHAAGLAKEGIAGPDGDDPSDGEDAGDVTRGEVESGQPSMRAEAAATIPVAAAAATTPNRKGKEKVGVSGGVSDIPFFDADVPETPLDPASDLAPRASRSKHPAGSTPDHAARPPKRASRVVQYVISSDEEGAKEPAVAETSSTQPAIREGPVEADNVVAPPSEEVNEQTIPASTSPRTASPSVVIGEPNVSSDQPRPSGQPESIDRPGPSKQPGTSASSSGFSHETPPVGPVEAD
ncbi:hypothetical protein LWI29_031028 [Acer saccharum]|uniref:Uncharacterized protein n=1 Tax=Acer saccharum TaxID=4024 RepID=A0AA39SAH0_ACESA|nr:hypothetical protein LWI29_031028 [Acer saccharum]